MNWILILILVALTIYAFYNAFALGMFGIPKSLSTTFYLFEERKSWLRIWFPIMMISVAFLLMPAWLELSANSSFQFLAFLAPSAIIFTGAAPAFKRSELENVVHTTSAIMAAITALLWVGLVAHLWQVILLWTGVIIMIMFISRTVKTSYIYWLETIAFLSTFTSLMGYYL